MMRTTRWRAHTLVEVMIAMALGLLILLAAMSLYRVQRAAYSAAVDAARLRDAAQAALALISQQIQMAGFVPLDAYEARAVPGLFGCAAGRPVGADGQAACDPLASRSRAAPTASSSAMSETVSPHGRRRAGSRRTASARASARPIRSR